MDCCVAAISSSNSGSAEPNGNAWATEGDAVLMVGKVSSGLN